MQLVASIQEVPQHPGGNVVAIGKWDGVHLAHQAVVEAVVNEARRIGGQSVVLGFHPLPMAVLRPSEAPPVLQTLEERALVLAKLGADVHLVFPFNPEFANLSPEEFVQTVLVDALHTRTVMVGFNFTFGRGGRGTVDTLRTLCEAEGISVKLFDPVRIDGETVSSTEVRLFVASGQMQRATRLLGRPFGITGMVVGGDKRGRTIGYPTANLFLAERRQLPATGVYVALATILSADGGCRGPLPCRIGERTGPIYGAMLNLGWRPTFEGRDLRCEVHLLDFHGDLYGQELKVEFLHRLRGEQAFSGIDSLRAQLAADEAAAREYLIANGQRAT